MFKLTCCNCGNEMLFKQVDNKVVKENDTIYLSRDSTFGDITIMCCECGNGVEDRHK